MEAKHERAILRLSAICIIAAVLLIPLDVVGLGPSLVVVVGLLAAAGALYVACQRIEAYRSYLVGLWLGPVVAVLVTVVGIGIGASSGELQSLGGLTGLFGVINVLLRPVYRLLYRILSDAFRIGRKLQEKR